MPPAALLDLVAYTEWANDRLLACAATLGADAWEKDLGGSFPTLGATLAHLVAAEWIWLHRWHGTSPTGRPAWIDAPTPEALRVALDAIAADRRAFLAGLSPEDLARPCAYTLSSGASGVQPLGDMIVHVVTHAAYHRGQVATMLRRLGAPPPATDHLVYLQARP